MTITTRSPNADRRRGFTLTEVLISASLGAVIMAGVLSTFLFIGRSSTNATSYSNMEAEARQGLERFGQDTRQASAITWNSPTDILLTVNGVSVRYLFTAADGTLVRSTATETRTLITGVGQFKLTGYMINGATIPFSSPATAAELENANTTTKQLQIFIKANRTLTTAADATNTVLSARFILRNKRVTA